jgi:hypothetical protein
MNNLERSRTELMEPSAYGQVIPGVVMLVYDCGK